MTQNRKIMIIAGEVSGDAHAAGLVREITALVPETEFIGIGGPELREAGVKTSYDVNDMAVMGLFEVLKRYSFFRKVFHEMVALARTEKPDAVILVDYPGFNLRFAKEAKKLGIKTIFYICPQVWAWHQSRIPKMAEILDQLITIFPFEKKYFEKTGLSVDYAGHPLVDRTKAILEQPEEALPWSGPNRVALLPGSRKQEIQRMLPTIWKAAAIIQKKFPDAEFIIPTPGPKIEALIKETIKGTTGPDNYSIITGSAPEVLRQARAAIVTSGTATIETALLDCPMIVAYKTSSITYHMAKRLIKVDNIGMVNIIAGREICPELIQDEATPEALAEKLCEILADGPERSEMLKELDRMRKILGAGNACKNAAEIVARVLGGEQKSDQ